MIQTIVMLQPFHFYKLIILLEFQLFLSSDGCDLLYTIIKTIFSQIVVIVKTKLNKLEGWSVGVCQLNSTWVDKLSVKDKYDKFLKTKWLVSKGPKQQ